jgi:hypothetical protein
MLLNFFQIYCSKHSTNIYEGPVKFVVYLCEIFKSISTDLHIHLFWDFRITHFDNHFMQNLSIKPTIFPTRGKEAIPITQSEFATCVSPVRHDQQNLGRFLPRTDTSLVFCNRILMRTDILFTRTTKPTCNFANPAQ